MLKTYIRIRPAAGLTPPILDEMWRLYEPHHQIDRGAFEERIADFDELALFYHKDHNTLVGFSGLRFRELQLASGQPVAIFYMGLTFIDRAWRSKNLIQRMVIQRMIRPWLSRDFHRIYFWTECHTFRPYLLMTRNLQEYFPSAHQETPTEVLEVVRDIGRFYYVDDFDQIRGTVQRQGLNVKDYEHRVSKDELSDPDIRFYLNINQHYDRGDGVIAICPVTLGNFSYYMWRQLRKSAQALKMRMVS